MPVINVSVKWGKEKFDDVELNTDESPVTFKGQLFALTGVAPDRQKIMYKGKSMGDDSNLTTFLGGETQIKDGIVLMMMGSADALPTAPAVQPKFVEDMSEGALNRALNLPPGLKNLGNTCYMNATLQCLKVVPELQDALKKFRGDLMEAGGQRMSPPQAITSAVRDLFSTMDRTQQDEVVPIIMLQILHTVFPQFADRDEHGHLRQQDANELWVEFVRQFQQKLPDDFVRKYFAGRFDVTLSCKEAGGEEEPTTKTVEDFYQLSCFLSQDVKYIHTGIKAKLVEEIVKNSPMLGRDAKYERKCALNRLPAYLTIQMVRFFYKERDQVNAKILKDVKFPLVLDVFDMCTAELQKKLVPMRAQIKEIDDREAESVKKMKKMGLDPKDEAAKKAVVAAGEDGASAKKNGSEKKRVKLPFSFPDDAGSNNSGYYELRAVLTHKGRSSTSGHYVGWVKRAANEWLMCDDDLIRLVNDEEILKLSGGGDWHCAYVLLYGPRILESDEEQKKEGESSTAASTTQSVAGGSQQQQPESMQH